MNEEDLKEAVSAADVWRQIHFHLGLPLWEDPRERTAHALREKLDLLGEPFPEGDEEESQEIAKGRFEEHAVLSGHHGGVLRASGVVFHHLGMSLEEALQRLAGEKPVGVSYHCLIAEDGTRYRLLDDHQRARHVRGEHKGQKVNASMLAVAFVGNTRTGKYRVQKELTDQEIASALEWLGVRWESLGFKLGMVTHHRAIDENRDDLPGPVWRPLRAAIADAFGEEADPAP